MQVTTISSAIKRAKESLKKTVRQCIVNNMREERVKKFYKSSDTISISEIPYLCPREELLALIHNKERKDIYPAKMVAIFETGNAFQEIIRDKALASEMLVGMWRCLKCDYVHGAVDGKWRYDHKGNKEADCQERIGRPLRCEHEDCNGKEFEYIEELLVNKWLNVIGHPDGYLSNIRYDHVLEIKTTNDKRFKEAKKKPFDEHLKQAMTYAWILQKKGIVLLYFNKNNGDFFTYEYKLNNHIINQVVHKVQDFRKYLEEFETTGELKELPPRICEKKTEFRAFKCEMCNLCFPEDSEIDFGVEDKK